MVELHNKIIRREMSFMKNNVAYKTKKMGCRQKMNNNSVVRRRKNVGYLGYKGRKMQYK